MAKPVDYVCMDCNSSEVVWDAYAVWDVKTQEMELTQCFDHCECCECGSENIEEVPHKESEVAQ